MDRKAVKDKFESGELRSDSVVKESLTTAVADSVYRARAVSSLAHIRQITIQ